PCRARQAGHPPEGARERRHARRRERARHRRGAQPARADPLVLSGGRLQAPGVHLDPDLLRQGLRARERALTPPRRAQRLARASWISLATRSRSSPGGATARNLSQDLMAPAVSFFTS